MVGREFIRLSIFVLVVSLSSCDNDKGTEPPVISQNPNLKLLTTGVGYGQYSDGRVSTEFPVWAPDNSAIYYINIAGHWETRYHADTTQIRRIDTGAVQSTVLFEGPYLFLAISPDGTTLATNIERRVIGAFPGGIPALIDVASGAIDTLPIADSLQGMFLDFSTQGDSLLFYATFLDSTRGSPITNHYWGGFFAFDLIDRTNHVLFDEDPSLVAGFALTPDGRQIVTAGKIRDLDGANERDLQTAGIWQTISSSGEYIVSGFGLTLLHALDVNLGHLPTDSLIERLWLIESEEQFYVFSQFRISPDNERLALCITVILPGGTGLDFGLNSIYILNPIR